MFTSLTFFRRPYHQGQRYHKLTLLTYSSICYSLYSLTLHPSLLRTACPVDFRIQYRTQRQQPYRDCLNSTYNCVMSNLTSPFIYFFLSISIYTRYISSIMRHMKGSVYIYLVYLWLICLLLIHIQKWSIIYLIYWIYIQYVNRDIQIPSSVSSLDKYPVYTETDYIKGLVRLLSSWKKMLVERCFQRGTLLHC